MSQEFTLPTYSTLYSFGDSLSDAGNLSIGTTLLGATEPVSPPYFQEKYGLVTGNVFSNGPTWVQDLSLALNLGTLAPSLAGGTDFAFGGAETGPTPQNEDDAKIQAVSLPSQFGQFQTLVPHPSATALYTLSIGSNDLLDILADTTLTAPEQTTDVDNSVNNEITFINQLIGDGAKNLLVLDAPDLGKTPDVTDGTVFGTNTPSATLDILASDLAGEYNTDLTGQLASIASTDTIDVTVVNSYQLIDNAVADGVAYGLTNVTSPVWSGSYTSDSSGTLAATGTVALDNYLFFDHLHPTERGELALANLAQADLAGSPAPPCFAAGTRIATERGEVAVQELHIGDRVLLAEGGSAPVVWLGHRYVDCGRHARPWDVQPVRIAAEAFGVGLPRRDLLLSPDHAICVQHVLIPARYLVNGATVRQEDLTSVEYWHVELPTHAVLLAEDLPAESYLDTGNRSTFDEDVASVMLRVADVMRVRA